MWAYKKQDCTELIPLEEELVYSVTNYVHALKVLYLHVQCLHIFHCSIL